MTQKSCAVGMRNAILRNHLKNKKLGVKGQMNQNVDISSSAILKLRVEKKSKKGERTKTTDDFMKLFLK